MVSCLGLRNDDIMVFICTNWSMTCLSTEECWETALALVTDDCIVVSDRMLIYILSMSVELLEMPCVETVDALAPWAGDLKPEYLLSSKHLMCVFKILNPDLPISHFFWSLTKIGLRELVVTSSLGFESSVACFDRQLVTVGKPLPKTFPPGLKCPLVLSYNSLWSLTKSTKASSSESVR